MRERGRLAGLDEAAIARALTVSEQLAAHADHSRGAQLLVQQAPPGEPALQLLLVETDERADVSRLAAARASADAFARWRPRRGEPAAAAGLCLAGIGESAPQAGACGWLRRPMRGERTCGDVVGLFPLPDGGKRLVVIDGLGHGPDAERGASAALAVSEQGPLERLPERWQQALAGTRGAVAAAIDWRPGQPQLELLAIGNITLLRGRERWRIAAGAPGMLGARQPPRAHRERLPAEPGSRFVLVSDGLPRGTQLPPSLLEAHPALIAAAIHACSEDSDDLGVLALAIPEEPAR